MWLNFWRFVGLRLSGRIKAGGFGEGIWVAFGDLSDWCYGDRF